MNRERIGPAIRDARQRAGLSQAELAKRLEFANQTSISNIERGAQRVDVETLIRIAQACDTDPAALVAAMTQEGASAHG